MLTEFICALDVMMRSLAFLLRTWSQQRRETHVNGSDGGKQLTTNHPTSSLA